MCPISALLKLKKQAKKMGSYQIQNHFLKYTKNKFSGHSFRAGVPSSLADFPNIANDWHVMGWGRWRSKIFLKYQNRTKKQSKWVFDKIENCLL